MAYDICTLYSINSCEMLISICISVSVRISHAAKLAHVLSISYALPNRDKLGTRGHPL